MIIKSDVKKRIDCKDFNSKIKELEEKWYELKQKETQEWRMFYQLEKTWKILWIIWEGKYEFTGEWSDNLSFYSKLDLYVFRSPDWKDHILIRQEINDASEAMDEDTMLDCYYYEV